MKLRINLLVLIFFTGVILWSCKSDDDDGIASVPPRDRQEVEDENQLELQSFLQTHFYNYEEFENPTVDFDFKIQIDTIAGDNSDKEPLINREELTTKIVNRFDVDYTIYLLNVREGEGNKPRATDSTFVNYKGLLLDRTIFDSALQPIWFDMPGSPTSSGIIPGLTEGLVEFGAATGFTENPDNTIEFNNDYGVGAAFIPSGLAYFSSPLPGIPQYAPIIFTFQMFVANEADHDRDGIPSYLEDLDGDDDIFSDNTDGDIFANYIDFDDDADSVLTSDEITVADLNNDGRISLDEITFHDTNNDGIADYLQVDVDGSLDE